VYRNRILAIAAVAAAPAVLAACGSSGYSSGNSGSTAAASAAASTSAAGAATVKTASDPKAGGTILVDSSGMTLYRLSGEGAGHFICTGSCLVLWHPLTVSGGSSATGVAGIATVKRPEGQVQVAYKGQPLYTFSSDSKPGDAAGQGIKDVGTWNTVVVSAPASSSGGAAPQTSSAGGEGGYHY